jgi:stress-induced morphogen
VSASCFIGCYALSLVTFEPESSLHQVEEASSSDHFSARIISVRLSGRFLDTVSFKL